MENLKWRLGAKAVAYIHLVLCTLTSVLVLFTVNFRDIVAQSFRFQNMDAESVSTDVYIATMVICVLMVGLYIFIDFLAAFKLYNATQIETEPVVAIKGARIWSIIFIIMFALGVLSLLLSLNIIGLAVHVGVRGPMLYVGWTYLKELEQVTKTSHSTPRV